MIHSFTAKHINICGQLSNITENILCFPGGLAKQPLEARRIKIFQKFQNRGLKICHAYNFAFYKNFLTRPL